MVIARKILLPTLAVFALLLLALAVFFAANAALALQAQEDRLLTNQAQVFAQELRSQSNVALALARQLAANPEVVQAFSAGDRLRLTTLTLNAYQSTQTLYGISQQQYVQSPARVLLRLQQIERYGDDLSATRKTVLTTNATGQDSSGLEMAEDGLGLRGVAYLEGGGQDGSVDIGISLARPTLLDLKARYGGDWQISLSREAMAAANFPVTNEMINGVIPELVLLAGTAQQPLFAPVSAYQRALAGETLTSRLEVDERAYAVITFPLVDVSNQVVGVVDIFQERSATLAAQRSQVALATGGALAGLLLIGLLLGWIIRRALWPVGQLTAVAQAFAEGDLGRRLSPRLEQRAQGQRPDELDLLARSFTAMAAELRRLVGSLEGRVAERTQDLERRTTQLRAVADIARDVTVATDVQGLLESAVQLVLQRFNFYHAGVFLIDDERQFAVLRAATGEAGQHMLAAGHRLRVGQTGIVGAAASAGQAHVAQDVRADAMYYNNPLLPDTRSEVGVPLRLGGTVIGVLDVQSDRPNAFDEGDIAVLQLLADQLAIAINNARLVSQLNRSVSELEQASAQLTRQAWSGLSRQQAAGYRIARGRAASAAAGESGLEALPPLQTGAMPDDPAADAAAAHARQALRQNTALVAPAAGEARGSLLSVPLRLRGQAVGVIQLRFDTPGVPPELVELVDEIGDRLALVLESARLLQEAQRLAAREQQINLITGEMRASVDMEAILQSTVRELGKALGARRTFIQLGEAGSVEAPLQPEWRS
ncbi:MAG: GAF domain-containing protein [Chloroflexota bacterium]